MGSTGRLSIPTPKAVLLTYGFQSTYSRKVVLRRHLWFVGAVGACVGAAKPHDLIGLHPPCPETESRLTTLRRAAPCRRVTRKALCPRSRAKKEQALRPRPNTMLHARRKRQVLFMAAS